ncbi:MAG: cadherin-like domain-containing protein, partial [Saprospiraceae bacterium]
NCSTDGGAVGLAAFGSACEANKTAGSSCQFYNDSRFAIELVCHEMGHQLAASHSWANCPGAEQQISTGTAFEPGSGSTIMSYSGACGSDNNVQNVADDYFHSGNVEQMLRERNLESSCANIISTNNNQPVVNLPYEDGFFIPISTPFVLKGVATDEDGDALTYAWEQINTGPAVPLGEPLRTAPTFRSFLPSDSPDRSFPNLVDLINNRNNRVEVLPTYDRNLTFRLLVRDNNPEAGGVDWQDVSFEATEEAGPFLVQFPNKISDVLNAGAFAEIKWDVAGTNTGKVNCQKVNILLSTNRGISYDHVLVENTDNDGTQSVTIPDIITDRARIKVEAVDNIFFDISNRDISIVSPTAEGFSFATSIQTQQVCLPNTVDIDLTTFSLLGFDKPIAFSGPVATNEGFSTSFSNPSVTPGNENQFSITFPSDYPEGEFVFDIIGVAEGVDTISRTISLDLVSNQFTDFALAAPTNNTSGVGLPIFQWTPTLDADLYEVEIATNPAFGDAIVDKGTNIIGTTYTPSITLDQSTIYYWRVNPINECGVGANSEIFAFQTQNLSCTSEAATNIPILISSLGTPTIESTMAVTQNFEISDLNIPQIQGSHDWVSHIRTTLISPAGTSAILFERKCPGSVPFNLGFDDESPLELPCPPIGGMLHQPKAPLSVFDGESTFGEWILRIEVTDGFGEGGSLDNWSLEFCGNLTLDAPTLVTNEVLPVKPKSGRLIDSEFLLAQDANNSATELIYTLVKQPSIGSLLFDKTPITVGAQFSQADLNNGAFKYRHDTDATEGTDEFTFTVSDGEGGWIGITPFQIILDESESTVSVAEILDESLVKIYPNPVSDNLQLDLTQIATKNALLRIFDVQGKLVYQTNLTNPSVTSIITTNFNNGLYFLKLDMKEGVITKKIVVQR